MSKRKPQLKTLGLHKPLKTGAMNYRVLVKAIQSAHQIRGSLTPKLMTELIRIDDPWKRGDLKCVRCLPGHNVRVSAKLGSSLVVAYVASKLDNKRQRREWS